MIEAVAPEAASDVAETKPCKVCAEPIRKAARYCNQCKSYQDWRGYTAMSQTVLALIIALVSVSASFIPVIRELIAINSERIHFAVQSYSWPNPTEKNSVVWILVTNPTSGYITVSGLMMPTTIRDSKSDAKEAFAYSVSDLHEPVAPGERKMISVKFDTSDFRNLFEQFGKDRSNISMLLIVNYTTENGEQKSSDLIDMESYAFKS